MRYFDIIETPKSGITFLETGENRIVQTDSRVSMYFEKVDLETKERYFDEYGLPQIRDRIILEKTISKDVLLNQLKVTTVSGKVFYADHESRTDLISAIDSANLKGETQTVWKLAEEYNGEIKVIVTLDEIREALSLALEAKAKIIGVI